MTITETTTAALDVRGMTDDELTGLYLSGGTAAAEALAEAERRDRADRMTPARRALDAVRAEGDRQAHAAYLEADRACRGELLSKAGKAAFARGEISGETALWRVPLDQAQLFASEELREWWEFTAPRVTSAEYVRQQAAERRRARTEARDHQEGGTGTMGAITRAVVSSARQDYRKRQASQVAVPVTGKVIGPGTVPATRNVPLVPGDQLLDLLAEQWFGYFSRFPSAAALDAVTLWAAHTHMRDEDGTMVFRATPRLYLLSRDPGSGKSHTLELLALVVPNCFGLDLEPTAPGLVYTLSREHATVLIDEGDVLLGSGSRRQAVRAILNGGYTRNGTYLCGRGAKVTRESVFGPVALAGLDTMEKDTGDTLKALLSRGIKIRMRKAKGGDAPAKLTAAAEESAAKIRYWLERWAGQVRAEVADAQPEIPGGLEGRAEQIWAPLLAIADAAGGSWPERARAACRELALGQPGSDNTADEFAEFAASFSA